MVATEAACKKKTKKNDSNGHDKVNHAGIGDKSGKENKKKKSKLVSESLPVEHHQLESLPGATKEKNEDVAPSEGTNVTDLRTEKKTKDKGKRKNKSADDCGVGNHEKQGLEDNQWATSTSGKDNSVAVNANESQIEEKSVKSKSKKKKKSDLAFESLRDLNSKDPDTGYTDATGSLKDDFNISDMNANAKDSKGSKKRKRLVSDENDTQPADKKEDEESKRRKIECSKESKGNEQQQTVDASLEGDKNAIKENKKESGIGQGNENIDTSAEKSSGPKSTKKQQNGFVEVQFLLPS